MRTLAGMAFALFVCGSAGALQAPEESSKLRWGVGAGFVTSPRPYAGAKPQTFPIPVVQIQYERWFLQGIRGGYELFSAPRLRVSAFAQARFQGLEPDPVGEPRLLGLRRKQRAQAAKPGERGH